ncbi:hypothetical protein WN48_00843 [Eufriesea mexicana]|uniref:Spondin domain-containing protein n=1 Tax=Eufriesea mexicana TaxID=516756 RepID=A0A310SMI8_9HYME|nr:hypothetical protein WN48_00843 [Eufriesea mexicana]
MVVMDNTIQIKKEKKYLKFMEQYNIRKSTGIERRGREEMGSAAEGVINRESMGIYGNPAGNHAEDDTGVKFERVVAAWSDRKRFECDLNFEYTRESAYVNTAAASLHTGRDTIVPRMFHGTWLQSQTLLLLLLATRLLFVVGQCGSFAQDRQDKEDKQDKLALYKVTLRTYWSRARFPRHYPEWKPPAQFGKLIETCSESNRSVEIAQRGVAGPGKGRETPETGRNREIRLDEANVDEAKAAGNRAPTPRRRLTSLWGRRSGTSGVGNLWFRRKKERALDGSRRASIFTKLSDGQRPGHTKGHVLKAVGRPLRFKGNVVGGKRKEILGKMGKKFVPKGAITEEESRVKKKRVHGMQVGGRGKSTWGV